MDMSSPTDVAIQQRPADACPTSPAGLLPTDEAAALAATFKALSDPVRLRVFLHVAAANCSSVCACHLPELFGVSQPTLSHHLKKLTESGLVHKEMRGRWAHFWVVPETVSAARNLLTICC